MKRFTFFCAVVFVLTALFTPAIAADLPDGFSSKLVTTNLLQPKGLDSALYRAGIGKASHNIIVAESGANQLVKVNPKDGTVTQLALTNGAFPVGVSCYGGPYGKYMYVGNAMGGGLVRVDIQGVVTPFSMLGMMVAGMDFGRGEYGSDLYVGEWMAGNIWRIDRQGNATLFANLPGCETRYMKFSHGGAFGNAL